MNIIDHIKARMTHTIEHFKEELKAIRTGRANPAMLDHIFVDVYGSSMRIKELASISSPEARLLLITPFDPKNVNAIAKGIERANVGYQPVADGNVVRIKIPPMDESMRKEMIKICHKRSEEAKVGVRNIRREANETVRKQKSNSEINEDIMKKMEKNIQEMTDKFCKEVDDITEKKEKEVLTV